MKEQLISFDTAKLAKEKGFEEYCFSYYDLKGNKKDNYLKNCSSTDINFRVDLEDLLDNLNRGIPITYSAPTQSLLQKWLREVHSIIIGISLDTLFKRDTYCIFIYKKIENLTILMALNNNLFSGYETYEEALEIGLREGLKLIEIVKNDRK